MERRCVSSSEDQKVNVWPVKRPDGSHLPSLCSNVVLSKHGGLQQASEEEFLMVSGQDFHCLGHRFNLVGELISHKLCVA